MRYFWHHLSVKFVQGLWKYSDSIPQGVYLLLVKFISRLNQIYGSDDSIKRVTMKKVNLVSMDWHYFEILFQSGDLWNTTSYKRTVRYITGIEKITNTLSELYGLKDLLKGNIPDIVYDVGANVGEFSIYCNNHYSSNIIAYEPDPVTNFCNILNTRNLGFKLYDFALSNTTGDATFYLAPDDADSSLFKGVGHSIQISIPTKRFDEILDTEFIKGTRLLKMDAEGFEPEVLEGFGVELSHFNWVTIDVSPERNGEGTGPEVISILRANGFQEVYSYSDNIIHARKN